VSLITVVRQKYHIVVNNDRIIPSHTMFHYMYMGLLWLSLWLLYMVYVIRYM